MKRISNQVHISLFLIIVNLFLFYLPVFLKPKILLERGNDLQEFFWPIFYFVKKQILENSLFPFWNNMFFSGTPLLPDPQSPLFYFPNLIFLFFSINQAFVISLFFHTFIASLGMYFLAKHGFKMSNFASTFSALVYLSAPKLAGYLEAGHFGLANSLAWLPFVLLAVIKIVQAPKLSWSIFLAFSLSSIFYTHTITFILAVISVFLFFVVYLLIIKQKSFYKSIIFFCLAAILTFGLIAVTLLPQIEWSQNTTRFLLIEDRDVYPKWTSFREFATVIVAPWWENKNNIWKLDSEKWVTLGALPIILSFVGFLNLSKKSRIAILISVLSVVIISLNNISPIYSFLLSWDWYVLARVATRVWFIPVIIVTLLSGLGIERLLKTQIKKPILIFIAIITIVELTSISWIRLLRPREGQTKFASGEIYEFLKKDESQFRVFCVNRCLSQKMVALNGFETIEGYGTLQQKNYYNHFIQLSQVYWDRYTLALPPFEIYNFREIQPYSPELADYNVKYVIAPYKLTDQRLVEKIKIDDYIIYENTINKGRAYFSNGENAPILNYQSNSIQVDTSSHPSEELILAEVWSPGWKAYINGKELTPIYELKNALRSVKANDNAQFVEFKYEPESFKLGMYITLTTVLALAIYIFKSWKKLLSS